MFGGGIDVDYASLLIEQQHCRCQHIKSIQRTIQCLHAKSQKIKAATGGLVQASVHRSAQIAYLAFQGFDVLFGAIDVFLQKRHPLLVLRIILFTGLPRR